MEKTSFELFITGGRIDAGLNCAELGNIKLLQESLVPYAIRKLGYKDQNLRICNDVKYQDSKQYSKNEIHEIANKIANSEVDHIIITHDLDHVIQNSRMLISYMKSPQYIKEHGDVIKAKKIFFTGSDKPLIKAYAESFGMEDDEFLEKFKYANKNKLLQAVDLTGIRYLCTGFCNLEVSIKSFGRVEAGVYIVDCGKVHNPLKVERDKQTNRFVEQPEKILSRKSYPIYNRREYNHDWPGRL